MLLESPKGKVTQEYAPEVAVKVEGDSVVVTRADDSRKAKSLHGLYRNLLKNALIGLSDGFSKTLLISGRGLQGRGEGQVPRAHPGLLDAHRVPHPGGDHDGGRGQHPQVTVKGSDRQQVGQICLRDPLLPARGAVQGQGHQVRERVRAPQGRQVGDQVGMSRSTETRSSMKKIIDKTRKRLKRKASIRKKIRGTPERPRLTVYKSNSYTYVQVIDDAAGDTLAAASNLEKEQRDIANKVAALEKLGAAHRGAAEGEEHHGGRVRQERLPLPRQGEGDRGRRAQGRHQLLEGERKWQWIRTGIGSGAGRVSREARQAQPGRQGRQGRPAVLLLRAHRGRRPGRPRRVRLRQGERRLGRHPQEHREGEAEHGARPHQEDDPPAPGDRQVQERAGAPEARGARAPGSSPAGPCAR